MELAICAGHVPLLGSVWNTNCKICKQFFFDLEHELGKHDKYDNEDDIIYIMNNPNDKD